MVGTNVGGCPLPPDVLFAGGQSENKSATSLLIDRLSNQTTGHIADIATPAGKQTQAGSTIAEGNAQALPLRHRDIGPEFAGGLENAQGHGLGGHGQGQRAGVLGAATNGRNILDHAKDVWIADDHAAYALVQMPCQGHLVKPAGFIPAQLDKRQTGEAIQIGPNDLTVLWMQRAGDQHPRAFGQNALGHENRLSARRRPIVHAGVGDFQAQQGSNQRLELENNLECPLADLGLIRRIGRGKLRPLYDLVNHDWHEVGIGSGSQKRPLRAVAGLLFGERSQTLGDFGLRQAGGKIKVGVLPQVLGQVANQVLNRIHPQDGQHGLNIVLSMRDVTHDGVGWVG